MSKLVEPMTVKGLVKFLNTQPQDLLVAYQCCSESLLLEVCDIKVKELCEPRPDGWVANYRPDKPKQQYLVFPGN